MTRKEEWHLNHFNQSMNQLYSLLNLNGPIWKDFLENLLKEREFRKRFGIWRRLLNLMEVDFNKFNSDIRLYCGKGWSTETFYTRQVYFARLIEEISRAILISNIGKRAQDWLDAQQYFDHLRSSKELHLSNVVQSKEYHFDLFRQLYEKTFPVGIRKTLGEFQTPFWLAKSVIDGFSTDITLPVCDPTCGIGTFLLGIINRLINDENRVKHDCDEIAKVMSKVTGFELNPLAVETSRLNLLVAYSFHLCPECQPAPIPIYFADTAINPFLQPSSEEFVTKEQFLGWINSQKTPIENLSALEDSELLSLISKGTGNCSDENQFLLGSIRAFLGRKAQTIIGNPPWIAWDGITERYRKHLAKQWKFLFTQTGWRSRVSAGRVDLSEIIVYSAHQHFSEPHSNMCFLLPESVFKSSRGGEGFRAFSSEKGIFSVTKVLDFTTLNLFPGSSNRTICAYFKNNMQQVFPVPWIVYSNIERTSTMLWNKKRNLAYPIKDKDPQSPWITVEPHLYSRIKKTIGKSYYRARGGVNTGGANPIFWVRVIEHKNDLVLVENIHRSIRMEVEQVRMLVEPEMLRPLIRGRDVNRWKWESDLWIIVPYIEEKSAKNALSSEFMRENYPHTISYFQHFKPILEHRKEYKRWGSRGPWYQLFRIGPYTFSKYKVIWQHTGFKDAMRACVIEDNSPIVDQRVILVPFNEKDEAHFFCSLLNSSVAFDLLSSYLLLDASTHVLENLAIGSFDPTNDLHTGLAKFSMEAHKNPRKAKKVETSIDELSRAYWGIK